MANLTLIGDSLVEFFDWQAGLAGHRVANLGRMGETAGELLARLPMILDRTPSPDWLLVMTGTNDVCMENFGFLAAYGAILAALTEALPAAVVVANSLLPIELPYLAADTVPQLNALLRGLAADQGAGFLDAYAALTDAQGRALAGVLEADGVHLADRGYALWLATVKAKLQHDLG